MTDQAPEKTPEVQALERIAADVWAIKALLVTLILLAVCGGFFFATVEM